MFLNIYVPPTHLVYGCLYAYVLRDDHLTESLRGHLTPLLCTCNKSECHSVEGVVNKATYFVVAEKISNLSVLSVLVCVMELVIKHINLSSYHTVWVQKLVRISMQFTVLLGECSVLSLGRMSSSWWPYDQKTPSSKSFTDGLWNLEWPLNFLTSPFRRNNGDNCGLLCAAFIRMTQANL